MFEVHKPKQKPIVVIRAASENELSNYEKWKLASIEEQAQENKIEQITLSIDGNSRTIGPVNKEVKIDLGSLATKSKVAPSDISEEDLFFIKCELDDSMLDNSN